MICYDRMIFYFDFFCYLIIKSLHDSRMHDVNGLMFSLRDFVLHV